MRDHVDPGLHTPLLWSDGSLTDRQAVDQGLSAWHRRLQAYIDDLEPRLSVLATPRLDFPTWPGPSPRMPLQSLVVGVKDIVHVDGFATRAGSLLPSHLWTGPEASVVSRLRQLGGLPIAKTTTTEFAYFEPGPTCNPWHAAYTPGGSSSGSAAGVAAGYFDIGIGTQTVGSVIRPAAFCGVCGFKPSWGLVPRDGVIIFSRTVDQMGFFARDWSTLCTFANHMMTLAPVSDVALEHLRFGLVAGDYAAQAASATRARIRNFAAQLEGFGWRVSEVELPLDSIHNLNGRHQDLIAHEFFLAHRDWFADFGYLYRPRTAALFAQGQAISQARYVACQQSCLAWRRIMNNFMSNNGLDVLISPSAVGTAPRGLTATGDPVMNLPWTHGGLPVTSVPLGLVRNECGDWLPMGAQLTAAFNHDGLLLRASQLISQRLPLAPGQRLKA